VDTIILHTIMSKLTFPILISLLVIWLISATWWFNKKYYEADSNSSSNCTIPFIVSQGSFSTKAEKTFYFEKSDWEPTIPLQALSSLKSVAAYLANDEKLKLNLKGWFGLNEINNSDFENIGHARAEAIKIELINFGAPENSISISSDSTKIIELNCKRILKGVEFEFNKNSIAQNSNSPKTTLVVEEKKQTNNSSIVKNEFNPKKTYIVFYNENQFKPNVNEELDKYFMQLSEYLKKNPKKKLLLMGHTDSRGNKDKHFNFGKYRARKLRDAIMEYGVAKSRFSTDSKGSSEPLESNETREGRNKNRRVEIFIK